MRPKTGPSVVVYFDANMPDVRECHRGCTSTATHFCRHRFGPRVWLVCKMGWLTFTHQSDLRVILDFLYLIIHRAGRCRGKKRYAIVTHDENFLADARREHEGPEFDRRPRLTWGSNWVECTDRSGPIRILVHYLPRSNRDTDLSAVVDVVRFLRASS